MSLLIVAHQSLLEACGQYMEKSAAVASPAAANEECRERTPILCNALTDVHLRPLAQEKE